jgi:undecaprenyl diphosphate synthase
MGNKLPQHIAIIMDGNGRWAKQRNLPRVFGHREGAERIKTIVEYCNDIGVKVLTLWAFSTENWNRPPKEVQFLMRLFIQKIEQEVAAMHKNNVQFRVIGNIAQLNIKLQKKIMEATELTANNNGLKFVLALNYSGRWDLNQAMQKIARQIERNEIMSSAITAELISQNLITADLPDPDLLIRTSGEVRISNFMLWQLAYTELYFTDTLWPDFNNAELEKALTTYAARERRFGAIDEKTT